MSNGGFSEAKRKSEIVVSVLQDVSVLIGEPGKRTMSLENGSLSAGVGLTSDAESLANTAIDIQQGIFKVLVLGEFKNGKSTLLNAMLGSKMLPARATPCTAIITMLVHGEQERVAVFEVNKDQPRWLSWDQFNEEFKLSPKDIETINQQGFLDRFQNVEYAQIECRHPFCANGIRLIDSPGLKEQASRTKVTMAYLEQSQSVIFVLNATKILTEDETLFIETQLGKERLSNVFFVINRIDLVDQDDVNDIKSWVQTKLKHHFLDDGGQFDAEFYSRRVFFVSSKLALDARISSPPDTRTLESSGVPALEHELERFLASEEKIRAALDSSVRVLTHVVGKANKRIAQHKLSLQQPLDELEQRRSEAEHRLQGLEKKKQEIERTILLIGKMIAGKIYANLMDQVNTMRQTWAQDSQSFKLDELSMTNVAGAFFSEAKKKQIAAALDREVQQYLQAKTIEWSGNIQQTIQPDVQKMIGEISSQVEDFQLELVQIGNIFTQGRGENLFDLEERRGSKQVQLMVGAVLCGLGDVGMMAGTITGKGDWSNFFLRAIRSVLVYVLLSTFLSGGLLVIAWIALGAALAGMQGRELKKRILENLGVKLHEGMQKELNGRQAEIRQQIEDQFGHFARQITKALQDQIDETRSEQERIISQKQDQGFSSEQEKRRLDAIATKLLDLCNTMNQVSGGRPLTLEDLAQTAGLTPEEKQQLLAPRNSNGAGPSGAHTTEVQVAGGSAREQIRPEVAATPAVEAPCAKCGQPMKLESRFCSTCGNPRPSVEPPRPAERLCPSCGNQLLPNARFCTTCGKGVAG